MSYLVCFYIEVENAQDQIKLERTLNDHGFAFYDATGSNAVIMEPTLEEIESILTAK